MCHHDPHFSETSDARLPVYLMSGRSFLPNSQICIRPDASHPLDADNLHYTDAITM
jgi:hypothetical protein